MQIPFKGKVKVMNTPERPYLTEEDFALLSRISHQPSVPLRRSLNHLWQKFLRWAAARPEPKITHKFDRNKQRFAWRVFDPETGKTLSLNSELEVRQWLEERYR